MHSHLNIQIKAKDGQLHDLTLADDASISVVDQNPLFHESEMFTYLVSMPLEGNRAIVQNIDDAYSDLRRYHWSIFRQESSWTVCRSAVEHS